MATPDLINGLIHYFCIVLLVTVHEFGHAFAAVKCGDNTPREQGRVTLNPLAHIDLMGTVILPLILMTMTGAIFGWGKPVQVKPHQFRHPRRDDIIVTLAGPFMNLLAAAVILALVKVGNPQMSELAIRVAFISLSLCFLNLLPIPPLDGSIVIKNLFRIPEEYFIRLAPFGFFFAFIALQIPVVQNVLSVATVSTLEKLGQFWGLHG